MPKNFKAIALLAEDVRVELGNKHTIIGTMAGNINVESFPANIKIAVYIVFQFVSSGSHDVDIQIALGNAAVAGGKSTVESIAGEPAVLVLPAGYLAMNEPSELRIIASVDGGRKETLVRSSIQIGDVSALLPAT